MSFRINPSLNDPLRLLSHEVVFSTRKEEEQEEGEQERKEDGRLLNIWMSLFPKLRTERKSKPIVLHRPVLKELAQKLNSSTLQDQIYQKLLMANHGPKSAAEEGKILITNLLKLNEKIDKANDVWFRKIPLVSRIFSVIERIRIPAHLIAEQNRMDNYSSKK